MACSMYHNFYNSYLSHSKKLVLYSSMNHRVSPNGVLQSDVVAKLKIDEF